MAEIILKSFAKINLSLDVKGVREDGYHELATVMQRLSLCDEVKVCWTPGGEGKSIELSCSKPFLPVDERNIAHKAAALMVEEFGEKIPSGKIEIYVEKRIPVAAGLAGGSGNGAAVLIALNRLWGLRLSTKKLCRLGANLGADVPFCVLVQNTGYGCALCKGRGEELTPLKNKVKKAVLLVKPSFGVSTREVYAGIDGCDVTKRPDDEQVVSALKTGRAAALYEAMANVLEDYTLNAYARVRELKDQMQELPGAEKVQMTGSGPTVFALFSRLADAQRACYSLREEGYSAYWAKMI